MNADINLPRFVEINQGKCIGCVKCVRVCPTRAIRVKNNKAVQVTEKCIGCGECMRVCETHAISAVTSDIDKLNKDRLSVALVSPILYTQFPGVLPQDVLCGLRRMGFSHSVDMSYFFEMFKCATEEFIIRNRETREVPWPLISPVCPVVLRLIAYRFPALLPNVHPIMRPVALMAREVKKQFSRHYKKKEEDIYIYYINPCPTKGYVTGEKNNPAYKTHVLGINDIFVELSKHVEDIKNSSDNPFSVSGYEFERCSTGEGLLWSVSGGEIAATTLDKCLAVSGIRETIKYLEKIEMGLFGDIEYIEFRTCREGCVGGSLNAIDKYLAKNNAIKLLKTLGRGSRMNRDRVIRLYDEQWFFHEAQPSKLKSLISAHERPLTIEELGKIDKLVKLINGNDCAACGAPDCRTFAEDVIRGTAKPDECLFIKARGVSVEDIFYRLKKGE